jgi:hypothetical protein
VTVSRRDFLKQSGAALAVIPAVQDRPASNLPEADGSTRELAMLALDAAKSAGATYADVRVSRAQSQSVATREDRVTNISDRDTMGFGIRVLAAGAWGFAASRELTRHEVQRVARAAVSQARANRRAIQRPIVLAPVDPVPDGRWSAPTRIDPFTIPIEDKVALLLRCNAEALKVHQQPANGYCGEGCPAQSTTSASGAAPVILNLRGGNTVPAPGLRSPPDVPTHDGIFSARQFLRDRHRARPCASCKNAAMSPCAGI